MQRDIRRIDGGEEREYRKSRRRKRHWGRKGMKGKLLRAALISVSDDY